MGRFRGEKIFKILKHFFRKVENRVFGGSNARKIAKKPKKRFLPLFSPSLYVLDAFFGISKFFFVGPDLTPQKGQNRVLGQYPGEGPISDLADFWARNRGFGKKCHFCPFFLPNCDKKSCLNFGAT